MTLHMRTALRMCSFLIYFKAFPANLFKSMNLVFCGFSEKGIWERREETVEVLSSQDFPCIRWRGGCGIGGTVWVAGGGGSGVALHPVGVRLPGACFHLGRRLVGVCLKKKKKLA